MYDNQIIFEPLKRRTAITDAESFVVGKATKPTPPRSLCGRRRASSSPSSTRSLAGLPGVHYKKGARRCATPVWGLLKRPQIPPISPTPVCPTHAGSPRVASVPRWPALRWPLHPGGQGSGGQPNHTGVGRLIGGEKTKIKTPHRHGDDWWTDWRDDLWSFVFRLRCATRKYCI